MAGGRRGRFTQKVIGTWPLRILNSHLVRVSQALAPTFT